MYIQRSAIYSEQLKIFDFRKTIFRFIYVQLNHLKDSYYKDSFTFSLLSFLVGHLDIGEFQACKWASQQDLGGF